VSYITVADLRGWLSIDDSVDDDTLSIAVNTAVGEVDEWCGRRFTVPTGTSVVTIYPTEPTYLRIDLSTLTGLTVTVDDDGDGVYESTYTIGTDFVADRGNDYRQASTDWPYTAIRLIGSRRFITDTYYDSTVQVTGWHGWPATPAPVKQATLMLAAEAWKIKDAPFGVAGFGDMGVVRVRDNPMVARLLEPYVTGARITGFA
jgi:hypothetical protein